jgi:thiol:disulfide interchange protein DsbD
MYKKLLSIILICISFIAKGQSVQNITWKASSERISEKTYKLIFETENNGHWDIYAPGSMFDDLSAVTITFADSSLSISKSIEAEGNAETLKSPLFEGKEYQVFRNNVTFIAFLDFKDTPPANLQCTLNYTYGKGDEFFPGETANVEITLEGGKSNATRILIPNLNINDPLQDCGTKSAEQKSSLWQIFILGLLGGFLALLTPCVFPMIPLTVSFFTKHQDNKKKRTKTCNSIWLFYFPDLHCIQHSFSFNWKC